MVVAIDGPSGVGKSTVSRALAAALGIPYLDTGSYYRAATLIALRRGVDPGDDDGVLRAMGTATIQVIDGALVIDIDGAIEDSSALRSAEVTAAVSTVAAHRRVRESVVEMQRAWVRSQGGSAVVEGRDIGTVVFPQAAVKIFLTADAEVRARRRAGDAESGEVSIDELRSELERRDRADSTRQVSPLVAAPDATTIDTSGLGVADVVGRILDLVGEV